MGDRASGRIGRRRGLGAPLAAASRAPLVALLLAAVAWGQSAGGSAAPPPRPPGAAPTSVSAPTASLAAPLLVLPFDNQSTDGNLDWIGEGVAEAVHDALQADGQPVLNRKERAEAFDQAGIPLLTTLSQATLIAVADDVDASWLITGAFNYTPPALPPPAANGVADVSSAAPATAGRFTLSATLINLRGEHLVRVSAPPGRLRDLEALEARLAWQVLRQVDPDTTLTAAQIEARQQRVALPAYENYIRGLVAGEPTAKLKYFLAAVRLQPDYSRAIYHAGLWYFNNDDYKTALLWLPKVHADDPDYPQAQFLAGQAAYELGDYRRAAAFNQTLAAQWPLPQVLNNWALAAAREREPQAAALLRRALVAEPGDPDLEANLAAVECRLGDRAAALAAARLSRQAQPDDDTAAFLAALSRPHARCPDTRASNALENLASDFPIDSFRQLAAAMLQFNAAKAEAMAPADRLAFHLKQGDDFLGKGALEAAEKEYRAALAIDAHSAGAHLGLARLYLLRQNWPAARAQLAVLEAIAPRDPQVRVLKTALSRRRR